MSASKEVSGPQPKDGSEYAMGIGMVEVEGVRWGNELDIRLAV